jgi:hypothetical protein
VDSTVTSRGDNLAGKPRWETTMIKSTSYGPNVLLNSESKGSRLY